ncbi:MAG: hypothetical protein HYS86_01830 [Candidatus Chisholmbacteria bacterium]|nr:hypothetical protein [Candidatus Chisholmbacteria bacterium]
MADRPYVTLEPTSGGKHPAGTEVDVTVHTVTLDSTQAEYELEYQAGSLLQGAFGSLDFTLDSPPVTKTLLLGTCSAGGKCDYNQDVVGGTLLLRLSGGREKFAVKGEWSYQQMGEREGEFSSRDSKFRLSMADTALPAAAYVIIMQTMGLPEVVEGEILAGPYHVAASVTPKIQDYKLEIRLSEDAEDATLLSWTGSRWQEQDSQVAEKVLTAPVEDLTTYVVVSAPVN